MNCFLVQIWSEKSGLNWTSTIECNLNSQTEECEQRWVQDNGWPEQYITPHLQICFIRINNKEHHDHITYDLQSKIHALLCQKCMGMGFLFMS